MSITMNPPSEANERAVTDTLGRKLVFRDLDVLEKLDIFEACGVNSMNQMYLGMAMLAGTIRSIDEVLMVFPKSTTTLRMNLKALGDAGIAAAQRDVDPAAPPADSMETFDKDVAKN